MNLLVLVVFSVSLVFMLTILGDIVMDLMDKDDDDE